MFLHHITSAIKNIDNNFSFDCKTFILGSVGNQSEKYNVLCLEIKRFIYNCRRKMVTLTIHGLRSICKIASAVIQNRHLANSYKSSWELVESLCNTNLPS